MTLMTLNQQNSSDSLIIFNRFRIDEDLPKFKKPKPSASNDEDENMDEDEAAVDNTPHMKANRSFFVNTGEWQETMIVTASTATSSITVHNEKKPSWLKRLFTRKPKVLPPAPVVSVKYVFDLVLSNPEELSTFNERAAAFQELMDRAKTAGQKSLVKQLEDEKEVRAFENALFAKGMKRYISERQLLKFVQGCERGLCLDWVQHFTRVIPKEVVDIKVKCDEQGMFDNYVVLHFDPQNKATTKQDRDKAKDPILFGVMRGSRKLYFIGDWVDELCDLTFQQLVDKLGANEQTEMK